MHHAMTKAGIVAFAKGLASELIQKGILEALLRELLMDGRPLVPDRRTPRLE